MRKTHIIVGVVVILFALAAAASAQCVKIQSGTLVDTKGVQITLGYDQWGYNYQAHMFNGLFDNFSRPPVPVTTGDVNLIMKWSDEWLSNQDCNGDQKLDRGLNVKTGASDGTSKGWLTNHMEGDCLTADGDSVHVTYFVKIVYDGGIACSAGNPSCLWGVYTVIEEVGSDPSNGICSAAKGLNRSSLVTPAGFGVNTK